MRNRKSISIILIIILVLTICYFGKTKPQISVTTSENFSQIIFPKGGESLVKGETYTLLWSGGQESIQIFLIDTSLKSAGTSVSISDRVYNIKNIGSYKYTVPLYLKEGNYEFQIGNRTSNTFNIVAQDVALKDGRQCFTYKQVATKDAPYSVNEFMDINILGKSVTGKKNGTQTGPDMTNGYSGEFEGTINRDTITGIFSYTVEGSSNKEKEIYRVNKSGIQKLRYPLKDEQGILIPDTTKEYKALLYSRADC